MRETQSDFTDNKKYKRFYSIPEDLELPSLESLPLGASELGNLSTEQLTAYIPQYVQIFRAVNTLSKKENMSFPSRQWLESIPRQNGELGFMVRIATEPELNEIFDHYYRNPPIDPHYIGSFSHSRKHEILNYTTRGANGVRPHLEKILGISLDGYDSMELNNQEKKVLSSPNTHIDTARQIIRTVKARIATETEEKRARENKIQEQYEINYSQQNKRIQKDKVDRLLGEGDKIIQKVLELIDISIGNSPNPDFLSSYIKEGIVEKLTAEKKV